MIGKKNKLERFNVVYCSLPFQMLFLVKLEKMSKGLQCTCIVLFHPKSHNFITSFFKYPLEKPNGTNNKTDKDFYTYS